MALHRHGRRSRTLTGTFGPTEIAVPRARLQTEDGRTSEWRSATLRAYQRRTKAAEEKIARAEAQAVNDVRAAAADLAIAASQRILADKMAGDAANTLTDASIRDLKGKLN